MNDDISLDQLHDIVLPPDVSWWPLAPGWYVVIGATVLFAGWLLIRTWRYWRANAYRRTARRALAVANSPAEISKVLRRTALAIAPRSEIAEQTGEDWADWLANHGPDPPTQAVRRQLARGVYEDRDETGSNDDLRAYAARWIEHHRNCEIGEP